MQGCLASFWRGFGFKFFKHISWNPLMFTTVQCTSKASFKQFHLKMLFPSLGVIIISSCRASRRGKNCDACRKSSLDWPLDAVKLSTKGGSARNRMSPRQLTIRTARNPNRKNHGFRTRTNPSLSKVAW